MTRDKEERGKEGIVESPLIINLDKERTGGTRYNHGDEDHPCGRGIG